MSESMIERVRDSIFREMDVADGLDLPVAQRYALAAIEAMREPTRQMLKAGMREQGTTLQAEYRAMIDAALIWPAGSADIAGVPMAED